MEQISTLDTAKCMALVRDEDSDSSEKLVCIQVSFIKQSNSHFLNGKIFNTSLISANRPKFGNYDEIEFSFPLAWKFVLIHFWRHGTLENKYVPNTLTHFLSSIQRNLSFASRYIYTWRKIILGHDLSLKNVNWSHIQAFYNFIRLSK